VEIKGLKLREDSQISHEEKCGSKCSAETGRRVHPLSQLQRLAGGDNEWESLYPILTSFTHALGKNMEPYMLRVWNMTP